MVHVKIGLLFHMNFDRVMSSVFLVLGVQLFYCLVLKFDVVEISLYFSLLLRVFIKIVVKLN